RCPRSGGGPPRGGGRGAGGSTRGASPSRLLGPFSFAVPSGGGRRPPTDNNPRTPIGDPPRPRHRDCTAAAHKDCTAAAVAAGARPMNFPRTAHRLEAKEQSSAEPLLPLGQ